MRATRYRSEAYAARSTPGRRALSLALAAGLGLLVILALLRLGGVVRTLPGDGRALATFDVAREAAPRTASRRARAARRPASVARERVTQPPERSREEAPPRLEDLQLPGVLILSRNDYRASDIGRIRRADDGAAGDLAGQQDGPTDASVGQGPGGEPMYAAEWYREPTRAELAPYLADTRARPGWGMVVCRTAPRFRVEDCRELGESAGSGIARMLRLASWQFLVRPPRTGGRPMIGTWVRIHFDLRVETAP